MKTNFYIDGFNLYFGMLKESAYKWLDIDCLAKKLAPKDTIGRVRYFTARISARPSDVSAPQRQQAYLRALQTLASVSVHYGHFLSRPVNMPLESPPARGPKTARVIRTEEKGSDVNLATHLLTDAFDGDFETAVIISNDSDLCEPIRVVRQKFGLIVGVVNPQQQTSHALRRVATYYRSLRRGVVASCQLPPKVTDNRGTVTKPTGW